MAAMTKMNKIVIIGAKVDDMSWEYEGDLAAASNGPWIEIPRMMQNISIQVEAAGGASCKVQYTASARDTVEGGTPIIQDWDEGVITSGNVGSASFYPHTAVRLVQSGAGTSKITIRAQ